MKILHARAEHIIYSKEISLCIDESAKVRGTGIARRTPEYIAKKIENRNAVIALDLEKFAGVCYIEIDDFKNARLELKKAIDFGKEKEANPWLSYIESTEGLRAAAS